MRREEAECLQPRVTGIHCFLRYECGWGASLPVITVFVQYIARVSTSVSSLYTSSPFFLLRFPNSRSHSHPAIGFHNICMPPLSLAHHRTATAFHTLNAHTQYKRMWIQAKKKCVTCSFVPSVLVHTILRTYAVAAAIFSHSAISTHGRKWVQGGIPMGPGWQGGDWLGWRQGCVGGVERIRGD